MTDAERFTVVSFHAHPDDEALLTSGTLAKAAAEGHRVVLVVATHGEAGATRVDVPADELARRRVAELEASAVAIGVERVVLLGYADGRFGETPTREAAGRLATILAEEHADVLTTYDEAGGYGHPDHVQVHHVGALAAHLAGTPVVLEATVDRELLVRVTALLRWASRVVPMPHLPDMAAAYTPRALLTHRIDVRAQLPAKVAALRAHRTQATGSGPRTLALLLALPRRVRRRVLGQEWFREVGRAPGGALSDDIFASLRVQTSEV